MLDVATPTHTVLSHDPVTWITTLSAMAATWATIWFKFVVPARRRHAEHDAKRDLELKAEQYRMSARWFIIDGMAGVEGMYSAVPPLAPRLREMEADIAELKARP